MVGTEQRAEVNEGKHWQLNGPTCPPIACFPSWFASPLCMFDKAVLENKNRCHKTPLRMGFACVMTPPVNREPDLHNANRQICIWGAYIYHQLNLSSHHLCKKAKFFFLFGLSCLIMCFFIPTSLISSMTLRNGSLILTRKTGLNKRPQVQRQKRLGSRSESVGALSVQTVPDRAAHTAEPPWYHQTCFICMTRHLQDAEWGLS